MNTFLLAKIQMHHSIKSSPSNNINFDPMKQIILSKKIENKNIEQLLQILGAKMVLNFF